MLLQAVFDVLSSGLPAGLVALRLLGRTLRRRADDELAFLTRPGMSNVPTEAIDGRIEHLRGSAFALTHNISRCTLETGGFKPFLHSQLP